MALSACARSRWSTARTFPTISRRSTTSVGRVVRVDYSGPGLPRVSRRLIHDLDRFTTASLILTEESVFGDMYLVEASRGCQWGCRFCAAGFMYRPIRYRSAENLIAESERGLSERGVIGLVGAEMASVPGVAEIAGAVADRGGRLSPSSLKADCISPALAAALARNGNRSVTVAPEAGSERMRKVINKNLTEAEILHAAELMMGEGVENLKCYFMVGLPEERDEDVVAIAELVGRIVTRAREQRRRVGRVTRLAQPVRAQAVDTVSVGRDAGGAGAQAQGRAGALAPDAPGWRASNSTPSRHAKLTFRPWSRAATAASARSWRGSSAENRELPGEIWQGLKTIKREVAAGDGAGALVDPDFFVTRDYAHNEILPWDFIDHHIEKWFLAIGAQEGPLRASDQAVRRYPLHRVRRMLKRDG